MLRLEGSCRCGSVGFSADSRTPYPFMRCYCSICRKTAGGGGYAINIMAEAATLEVRGEAHIAIFHAPMEQPEGSGHHAPSSAERRFCRHCATALWLFDDAYAQSIYPFASAIDTKLPVPPERFHIMLDFKPSWVVLPEGPNEVRFDRYPPEGIEDWHRRHELLG